MVEIEIFLPPLPSPIRVETRTKQESFQNITCMTHGRMKLPRLKIWLRGRPHLASLGGHCKATRFGYGSLDLRMMCGGIADATRNSSLPLRWVSSEESDTLRGQEEEGMICEFFPRTASAE